MPRNRPPNRRLNIGVTFYWPEDAKRRTHVSLGYSAGGPPIECFLRGGGVVDSERDYLLDDVGVLISRCLQHGDTLAAIAEGLGKASNGGPSSLIGACIVKLLELEGELKNGT